METTEKGQPWSCFTWPVYVSCGSVPLDGSAGQWRLGKGREGDGDAVCAPPGHSWLHNLARADVRAWRQGAFLLPRPPCNGRGGSGSTHYLMLILFTNAPSNTQTSFPPNNQCCGPAEGTQAAVQGASGWAPSVFP